MRKYLPDPQDFLGKQVPDRPQFLIKNLIRSGNNGHVFRAYSEMTEHQLACKIVPVQNLPVGVHEKELWLEEAKKPNRLRHRSVVHCDDVVEWPEEKSPIHFVVFVYEYIPGISLREYIEKNKNKITMDFIEELFLTLLSLLHEMKGRGIDHGDLHSGNIIVAEKSPYDLLPRETFRVIDFGVRAITSKDIGEGDFLQVAGVLRSLLENVDYQTESGRNKYSYNVIRNEFLQRHLIETNPLVDDLAQNPELMYKKLEKISSEYTRLQSAPELAKLEHPFDYPNCEQMGNRHLLLKSLYSDRFLGLSEIESKSNLILTGPRGCGKTTVFKALSLEHRISVGNDDSDDIRYIGIYYRCDDLYFAFPRYKASSREEAINIPLHFIIVTLLSQLLETIKKWASKKGIEEFSKTESNVTNQLWELLSWENPNNPGSDRFECLVARLQKERNRAVRKSRMRHVATEKYGEYFGPEILVRACEYLRSSFGFLSLRPIYFFIDDYSTPKITSNLQENLNRLFMYRSPDCFYKISTESPVSYISRDLDGKSYTETREYNLLNLGIQYLKGGNKETLLFLEDLFDRRFKEVENYPVSSLEELVGSYPRIENEIARQLKRSPPPNNYYGKQTLAALCSGDIHYMIRLVGRMVDENGGKEELINTKNIPKIPFRKQHSVIRSAAGDFLESIRLLPKYGKKLAAVVTAFGSVARSYLLYKTSKNEGKVHPHQASRIEPYTALNLSQEAEEIYAELLRYSIFLYDPRGKSRRGEVVPRLYLRRYLIPHFNLTFSRRDSVSLENKEIEKLLLDPQGFEKSKRKNSKENRDELTGNLYPEESNDND